MIHFPLTPAQAGYIAEALISQASSQFALLNRLKEAQTSWQLECSDSEMLTILDTIQHKPASMLASFGQQLLAGIYQHVDAQLQQAEGDALAQYTALQAGIDQRRATREQYEAQLVERGQDFLNRK